MKLENTKCPKYQPYALAYGHYCCGHYYKDANGDNEPSFEDSVSLCPYPKPCRLDGFDTCQGNGPSKTKKCKIEDYEIPILRCHQLKI